MVAEIPAAELPVLEIVRIVKKHAQCLKSLNEIKNQNNKIKLKKEICNTIINLLSKLISLY